MIFFKLLQRFLETRGKMIAGVGPTGKLANRPGATAAVPAITVKPNGGPRLVSTDGITAAILTLKFATLSVNAALSIGHGMH